MPSPFNHFMIDIETYATKPSAVILSIGAEHIMGAKTFYEEIDLNTQVGRSTDEATVAWWSGQSNPPIHGTTTLHNALLNLSHFLRSTTETGEPIIWCKGTDFDTTILAHAYNSLYIPVPWKYNNVRDCRTIFKLCDAPKSKATHNALEDAMTQADTLVICLAKFGLELK